MHQTADSNAALHEYPPKPIFGNFLYRREQCAFTENFPLRYSVALPFLFAASVLVNAIMLKCRWEKPDYEK